MSRIKAVLAAVLAAVLGGCAGTQPVKPQAGTFTPPTAAKYTTCTVTRGDYSYTPTVRPLTWRAWVAEEPVYYNDREGMRIAEFPVSQGQVVQKGALLLRLESEEGETALMELSKELTLLKGEYELEKGKKEREIADIEKDLAQHRYYEEQLSVRQTKLQRLKVEKALYIYEKEREIRLKEEAVEKQREKTGDVEWRAPNEGRIFLYSEAEKLKEGEKMPVNTPVLILDPLEAQIYSVVVQLEKEGEPEKRIYYGMEAQITVTPEKDAKARVTYTGKVVGMEDREPYGKTAVIRIMDPDCEAFSNVNEIKLAPIEEKDVLIADRRAVRMREGLYWVTVLEDGVEKERRVEPGPMDIEKCVILDGVEEGQQLLI